MNKKARNWFKKQPNTIFINDVEIPSYQKYWQDQMEAKRKISRLKTSNIIQYACIIILSIAVIILAQK